MTILAIFAAALLGGASHFAPQFHAVGAKGPSAIAGSGTIGGGLTVQEVVGGGPTT